MKGTDYVIMVGLRDFDIRLQINTHNNCGQQTWTTRRFKNIYSVQTNLNYIYDVIIVISRDFEKRTVVIKLEQQEI